MYPNLCPYCVEGNGFIAMVNRASHCICLRCGHVAIPRAPDYQCSCNNCCNNRGEESWVRLLRETLLVQGIILPP